MPSEFSVSGRVGWCNNSASESSGQCIQKAHSQAPFGTYGDRLSRVVPEKADFLTSYPDDSAAYRSLRTTKLWMSPSKPNSAQK